MSVTISFSGITATGAVPTLSTDGKVSFVASDHSHLTIKADPEGGFTFNALTVQGSSIKFSGVERNSSFNGSINLFLKLPADNITPVLQVTQVKDYSNVEGKWSGGTALGQSFNSSGMLHLTGFKSTFQP